MTLCERCGKREAVQYVTIEVNDEERTIMVCQRCAEVLEQESEDEY